MTVGISPIEEQLRGDEVYIGAICADIERGTKGSSVMKLWSKV